MLGLALSMDDRCGGPKLMSPGLATNTAEHSLYVMYVSIRRSDKTPFKPGERTVLHGLGHRELHKQAHVIPSRHKIRPRNKDPRGQISGDHLSKGDLTATAHNSSH